MYNRCLQYEDKLGRLWNRAALNRLVRLVNNFEEEIPVNMKGQLTFQVSLSREGEKNLQERYYSLRALEDPNQVLKISLIKDILLALPVPTRPNWPGISHLLVKQVFSCPQPNGHWRLDKFVSASKKRSDWTLDRSSEFLLAPSILLLCPGNCFNYWCISGRTIQNISIQKVIY